MVSERLKESVVRVYGHFYDGSSFGAAKLVDPGPTPISNPVRFYQLGQYVSNAQDSGFVMIHARPEGHTSNSVWITPFSGSGFGSALQVNTDIPAGNVGTVAAAASSTSRSLICFWYVYSSAQERHFYCASFDGSVVSKPSQVDHGAMPVEAADDYPELTFSKSGQRAVIVYSFNDGSGVFTAKAYGVLYDGTSFSSAAPLMASGEYGENPGVHLSRQTDSAIVSYLKSNELAQPFEMRWLPVTSTFGTASTLDQTVDTSMSLFVSPRFQFSSQSEQGLLLYATRAANAATHQLAAYWYDAGNMTVLSPNLQGFMALKAKLLGQSDRALLLEEKIPDGGSYLAIYGSVLEQKSFAKEQRLDPGLPNTTVNASSIVTDEKSNLALVVMYLDDLKSTHEKYVSLFDGQSFGTATQLPGCSADILSTALGAASRFLIVCNGAQGLYGKVLP